ncbi:hypothetical protein ES703_88314 [subsurface metagenome]
MAFVLCDIMYNWLKKNSSILITILATIGVLFYLYGCEPKTRSLSTPNKLVNRQELQLELDQIMGLAQLRMLDLDKQDAFRSIIIQNSLLVAQGQPFNPVGLITAIAGIYGAAHAATKSSKYVSKALEKRKVNNG